MTAKQRKLDNVDQYEQFL